MKKILKPLSKPIKISIVIPSHLDGAILRKCLESLKKADPKPLEIILVVDGDFDANPYKDEGYVTKLVKTDPGSGPARARNAGVKETHGDVIMFIDSDVAIHRDTIGLTIKAFNIDKDLAAVFGSYDDNPPEQNFLSQFKNLFNHYLHQTANEEASTFWTACGAIRKDVFCETGGFSNILIQQPFMEDVELGYRLKSSGYKIKLDKSIQATHLKRWTFLSLLHADIFYRALPWTRLILKAGSLINDLNLKISDRISVLSTFSLLGCLGLSWTQPAVLLPAASIFILLLLSLNFPLYRFFFNQSGARFCFQAILWHWFYFFYSGTCFGIGMVLHVFDKLREKYGGSSRLHNFL